VKLTGDDIVVEYVERILKVIQDSEQTDLPPFWVENLLQFIHYPVWHTVIPKKSKLYNQ